MSNTNILTKDDGDIMVKKYFILIDISLDIIKCIYIVFILFFFLDLI